MLKKTINYTDFNGEKRTEDFYFNLTKAQLMELELGKSGGLTAYIEKITNAQSGPEILALFKELILIAYGEKDPEGKRFIKNDALREAFSQTEAYSELFMELVSDDEAAAKFINGIVPADISAETAKLTPAQIAARDVIANK